MESIEQIEKRLWSSADNLRANSNYVSNEYFLPVMGLIFLCHAFSRFERVKALVEPTLPKRGGKTRELRREDFSGRGAIFLGPEARFDYLVALPEDRDLARAIVHAMESIEEDYETLKGVLPKQEYQQLDNDGLRNLLRTFNDPALKQANGDVFGRIYEYFLTQFADLAAHDNGEFFTPMSLVQMIVNVIEPDHGTILDPACGSGVEIQPFYARTVAVEHGLDGVVVLVSRFADIGPVIEQIAPALRPSSYIDPPRGFSTPANGNSGVVLPERNGPMTATASHRAPPGHDLEADKVIDLVPAIRLHTNQAPSACV